MAKYSSKTQEHVENTMHRMKKGKLKSGRDGKGGTVKDPKQAIAIALSEAREKGYKAPKKAAKKSTANKTTSASKPGPKKAVKKAAKKSSPAKRKSASAPKRKSAAKKKA